MQRAIASMEGSAAEAQSNSYSDEARFRMRLSSAMRVHGDLHHRRVSHSQVRCETL